MTTEILFYLTTLACFITFILILFSFKKPHFAWWAYLTGIFGLWFGIGYIDIKYDFEIIGIALSILLAQISFVSAYEVKNKNKGNL